MEVGKVISPEEPLVNGDVNVIKNEDVNSDENEENTINKLDGDLGLEVSVNSRGGQVDMTEDSRREDWEKKDHVQILTESETEPDISENMDGVNGKMVKSTDTVCEEENGGKTFDVFRQSKQTDESEDVSKTSDVRDSENDVLKAPLKEPENETVLGSDDKVNDKVEEINPSKEKENDKAEDKNAEYLSGINKGDSKKAGNVSEEVIKKPNVPDIEPGAQEKVASPSKNLRKRKLSSNGYKEDNSSSDEDYKEMIIEKKPKLATEKSVSVPVGAQSGLDAKTTPVVPLTYNVGQPVSLVGTSLIQNQQVRMVIPSVSSNIISQPVLISQPQTNILTTQGLALNTTGVVLYPQLRPGTTSAVMSTVLTTAAQKINNTKPSYEIAYVGASSAKTAKLVPSLRENVMVTSVTTVNNKPVAKIDKLELRTPSNSYEMIQLVKWELKQGVYHRPKNFKLKPDSELGSMAKFLRDFGQDLVKESVYSDLVNIQSRRSDHGKLTDKEKKDFHKLKSVHSELKEKVGPVKVSLCKKCKCGFKTESDNVMYWHMQHPHIDGNELKCALCDFETRDSSAFSFHMEAEHSRKARFIEKPAFWACSLCPYETNLRNKLTQHRLRCIKTFKLTLNLHPAWLPGPEANYCLEKTFYRNPVVANMNRLQQQQQQAAHQLRNVMPIMPKGPTQHVVNPVSQQVGKMKPIPYSQMSKGPVVNTQAVRNPTLLAKLGQQNLMRNIFPQKTNYTPNVNLFQGQKTSQLTAQLMTPANMAKKTATNVTYVRPPNTNVSTKINNIITVNSQVLDKGQTNKPSGFEVCEICGGYVKDRTALRIHFFYAHRIDMPHGVFDRVHPPLYCATCFARFWTAQGLQKHLDVHKEDSSGGVAGKCIVCLHRVPNILMHMKIVHNKAFVNFLRECKCIFCGLKFPNKSVVESHMAAVHGVVVKSGSQPQSAAQSKKPVNNKGQKSGKNDLVKGSVCVLCNLNFGRNVDLTRHCMRVHHTCMKCGMVVADKESLMKHSCLESPSGLRNCEICKEKGFHPAYHVKHIRDKHLKKLSVKVKRLDRKTVEKWTKKPAPWPKKYHVPMETIELSDDDEPYAKRLKVDGKQAKPASKPEQSKQVAKPEQPDKVEGKKEVKKKIQDDDVVMLIDDDDDNDKKVDKPNDKLDQEEKVKNESQADNVDRKGDKNSSASSEKSDDEKGDDRKSASDSSESKSKDCRTEMPTECDTEEKLDVDELAKCGTDD